MRTKEQTAAQNRAYHQRHREAILTRQAHDRRAKKTGPDVRRWHVTKMLADAKQRARVRGLTFALVVGDVATPDCCPVFGLPLAWGNASKRTWSSPSLDRIDSRLGYTALNVWVISWRANAVKGDASPVELRAVAKAVDAKLRSKRKSRGVIELPALDGEQHAAFPEVP